MLCHLKGRMAEKPLKSKSITMTVNKEFSGESMAKSMKTGLLNSSSMIISANCVDQASSREHFTEFIAKQIIRGRAFANNHIITKNINHRRAKGDDLDFSCFGVTE